jgi:murein DD-endopeptidase MepM/ murein hydrolase activator NlpD
MGLAQMAAAAPLASGALQPPLSPACISSPFGWRHAVGPHAPAGFHNGIDIPAPAGAYIRAAAAGRVVIVKRMGMGGLQIILDHGGFQTLYAHLGSVVPAIAEGKRTVVAGEPIGRVGWTGVSYGTHVFFEVLEGGKPVDPNAFLGLSPCRR